MAVGSLGAQTLYWGPNASGTPLDGTGTWNTSLTNWTLSPIGPTYQAWAAAGTKVAVFDGVSGTVTLGSAVQANALTFNTGGYLLNGNNNAITLVNDAGGFSPTFRVTNPGDTATINARLSGSKGLNVRGAGTLVLSSSNNFTGGTTVIDGTLKLMVATGSINAANSLKLGGSGVGSGAGGTFIVDNTGASGAISRGLAGISVEEGDNTIQTNRVAAQNLTFTFTTQTRFAGSTLNYVTSGGVNGTSNKIVLSGQATGFLDQGTFFSGSSFAWRDSTGYVRAIAYGTDAGSRTVGTMATVSSTSHLQITGAITSQTSGTFTSLKMAGANDFTIASGNTVTVDGVLKAGGNAASLIGGTIQSGSTQELVVRTDLTADALTIGAIIADSASGASVLTKSGAGVLTLTGNNTYSGGTYFNSGTVSVGSLPTAGEASALGTGSLIFAGGALQYTGTSSVTSTRAITVDVGGGELNVAQPGATLTLSGAVYGGNLVTEHDALTISGGGLVVFSGTDDNSGLILRVNSGTVQLAKASADFLSAVTSLYVNNGGTVVMAGTGTTQIGDNGIATINAGGVLDFNGHDEAFDGLAGNGSVTNNSSSTNATVTLGTANGATATNVATFGGVISNGANGRTMALYKINDGVQVLTGANTYTGGTIIESGMLQIGNGGTTGSVAGNIATGNNGFSGTLAFNRSDAFAYSGTISDIGVVRQFGSGTLTLSAVNTYTGTTTISAGTLRLGSAGSGQNGPLGSNSVGTFVTSGGALDLNGFTLTSTEALSLVGTGNGGAGALVNSSSTAASYSGVVTIGTGGASIGGSGNITLSSALANTANTLTKAGSNQLTLTTNSSRTGSAIVTGGTLRLLTTTALGTNAVGLTLNGGNLALANNSSTTFGAYSTTISAATVITADRTTSSATGVTHTLGALFIGGQTLTVNRGSLITGSGTGGLSFGAVTLTADGATFSPSASTRLTLASVAGAGLSFAVAGAGDTVVTGAVAITTGTLSKSGTGLLMLSGSGNYSGGTSITGGTLVANNNNALGTGAVVVGTGAVFLVPTGISLTNTVTVAGGTFNRQVASGASLANAINSTSRITGGQPDTGAALLGGTTSAVATLQSSFSGSSAAGNDVVRLSDVLTLGGVPVVSIPTGQTDTFVLQLTVSNVTANSMLGWLDTNSNTWVNAVAGNIGGVAFFAGDRAYNPLTDFNLGTYGIDTANHTAWAVVDHNSDFAVIAVPEPGTWGLFIAGSCFVLLMRRRIS